MAWRIRDLVLAGELDNTVRGRIVGWIHLTDRQQPLRLDLRGNCHRDLAGWRFRIRRLREVPPWADQLNARGLTDIQHGEAGDIFADQLVRDFDCSREEFLMRMNLGDPLPEELRPALYLEWFSDSNGRVVIHDTRLGVERLGQRQFELSDGSGRHRLDEDDRHEDEALEEGWIVEEPDFFSTLWRQDEQADR